MRRMGIYLGLVEDEDVRQYGGRYDGAYEGRDDVRGADHGYPDERHPEDRRYPRYRGEDSYDERADAGYRDEPAPRGAGYRDAGGYADAPYADEAPEPLARRVAPARPLGLAPAAGPAAPGPRAGGTGASASGLSVRDGGARDGGLREGVSRDSTAREPVLREVAPVAAAPEPAPAPPPQPYRITTLHPRTYNEARVIGERFRDGMPVIMNLTEMDDADAKRLVDFAAGLSFGLRGSIERVTAKVFLLSPRDVDVTAEDKARIREGGFFNQS
jgi:cell division inhibitor SepF